MSILETPRVYFKGDIAWDPIVTNNTPNFYDEDTGESVLPAVRNKVQAFRGEAVAAVTTGGNWNPHGTHRSVFYKAAISGVELGSGVVTTDPFVKSAANFTGMLVDLEPYGAYTSQLFFDAMQFGIDGGYRILGKRTTRAIARYINFTRNPANSMIAGVASVVWQTSFAKKDGLLVDAFDSPTLMALDAALKTDDVQGLTVRFNTYRTVYFDDPTLSNGSQQSKQAQKVLAGKLLAGGFQPNPARSVMVGVIGLWRKGEPAHEPGDRALLAPTGAKVASAHARLGSKTLTLDLSNSISETSRDLTKQDLGPLSVVAVDAAGKTTSLGTIPYAEYDRTAYDASSGIVTLPLTAEQVQSATNSDLQLRDSAGAPLLAEEALRAIALTPNLYLDQGVSATASFQVYQRGAAATGPLPVTVYKMNADGGSIDNTSNMHTDASGILSFSVTGAAGGIFAYVPSPTPGAPPPDNGIDTQVNTYMYVRTLPADADVAALPPTWDNVYTRVLANWNAMAPCMDNWLMLNDPAQVKNYATVLKRLTDPAHFEAFRFMPVTRDMTPGERILLYKFLDAPAAGPVAKLSAEVEAPSRTKLSRAMRGG